MRITPVVLAGGLGERLWPLSTAACPKQFGLRDANGHSLFQATLRRVNDRAMFHAPMIICNHAHRFLVLDQLREIGIADATLMIEPERRNSAPAIALAAMEVKEGLMLVLPSDHRIDRPEQLVEALKQATAAAAKGAIVTFAMAPTAPETGYGYIQYGAPIDGAVLKIKRFTEKPDRATAEGFLRSGDYGWNSGIFLMEAAQVLNEFAQRTPEVYRACDVAYTDRTRDHSFIRPEATAFCASPNISFDYAVMETTARGAVIKVAMGWDDYGSWAALDAAAGTGSVGSVAMLDVKDSYIHAVDAHVAAIGVENLVVVATPRHVLVTTKDRTQEVKQVIQQLQAEPSSITHRPWGQFHAVDQGDGYQVKKLTIRPGSKISLQTHRDRSEHWVVVKGTATVTRGDETLMLKANESAYIEAGQQHRLENRGHEDLIVIEVQTGSYLGEDDITRLEDAYPL